MSRKNQGKISHSSFWKIFDKYNNTGKVKEKSGIRFFGKYSTNTTKTGKVRESVT